MTVLQRLGAINANIEQRGQAVEFMRLGIALAVTGGGSDAREYFKARWPNSRNIDLITKAAVAAGSTATEGWAGALAPMQQFSAAFIEYFRPLSVLDRIKPAMRTVPFNVRFPRGTAGSSVGWTGQGRPAKVTRLSFEALTFATSKIGGVVVTTKELARLADPAAEELVRTDLAAACAASADEAFLDPALDAVADVSPASITFGASNVDSTGSDAAAVEADFATLFAAVTTNMVSPFLIMRNTTALALARLRTTSGDRLFPDVGVLGGSIWGVPVITSENVPQDYNSPATNLIVLIDASEILLAEGDIVLAASEQATIEMDDDPDHPADANTVLVSLWERNLSALKATRFIRWQRRRENSVAFISGVPF